MNSEYSIACIELCNLLELCNNAGLIKTGYVTVEYEIAFTYYDYESDDFEKAGIMPGVYEYRVYSLPGGYKSTQLVIDGCENDLPSYCNIINDTIVIPEIYARRDAENNLYYDIPA